MIVIHFIIHSIINFMIFMIFLSVILSWLVGFNVVNRHNQFVNMIWGFANAITEPLMRPVRQLIPSFGGIDISPLVVLLGLNALQIGLHAYVFFPARP